MNAFAERFSLWLADVFLLTSILLIVVLVTLQWLEQPVRRLAITKSAMIAMVLLGSWAALPGWSIELPKELHPIFSGAIETTAQGNNDNKSATNDRTGPAQRRQSEPNILAGRITDEVGKPLSDIKVELVSLDLVDRNVKHLTTQQTDEDGCYRFDVSEQTKKLFPDGTPSDPENVSSDRVLFRVVARAPGRITVQDTSPAAMAASWGRSTEQTMGPAATLRGRVTGPDGRPIAVATVSTGPMGMHTVRTDDDGNFVINDIAPFDFDKYMDQERNRAVEAVRTGTETLGVTDIFTPYPPVLTITHGEFATKSVKLEHVPGTTDVKLESAAEIAGRVLYAGSGLPAGNVMVQLNTMSLPPKEATEVLDTRPHERNEENRWFDENGESRMYSATTRTDRDGTYRFKMLPAKQYDLWAETAGWLNNGISQLAATASNITTAPDLALTRGGAIRIRLINADDGKPVHVPKDALAIYSVAQPESQTVRPLYDANTHADENGICTIRVLPGATRVISAFVRDGDTTWSAKVGKASKATVRNANDREPVKGEATQLFQAAKPVEVVDGETINLDVQVQETRRLDGDSTDNINTAKSDATKNGQSATNKLQKARTLLNDSRFADTIAVVSDELKVHPQSVEALMLRFEAYNELGQYQLAAADLERVINRNPPAPANWIARNNFAYLLATCPDEKLRDGKRAVKLAEEALTLAGASSLELSDSLAASYAETGDYERAVTTMREAIQKFPEQSNQRFQDHLKLYESGQPLREKQPDAKALPQQSPIHSSKINLPSSQTPLKFVQKRNSPGDPTLFLNERQIEFSDVKKLLHDSDQPVAELQVSLTIDKGIAYGQAINFVDLLESLGV